MNADERLSDDPTPEQRHAPTGNARSEGAGSLLLVVGSGRSGTSLFASLVRELGYHVPQPEVAADDTNPRGFAESRWVVDFHTALLRQGQVQGTADARPEAWEAPARIGRRPRVRSKLRDWLESQFEISTRIVVKDPRLLWFFPLWQSCAEDLGVVPRFVTMLRHPAEVVVSKERWYGGLQNPSNRMASWTNTMLRTERATRGATRSFVQFEELLGDWRQAITQASGQLSLSLLEPAGAQEVQRADQLVEPSLNRSQASLADLDLPHGLAEIADRTWTHLSMLVRNEGDDRARAGLDRSSQEYDQYYRTAEAVTYSSILAARRAEAAKIRSAQKRAKDSRRSTNPKPSQPADCVRSGARVPLLVGFARKAAGTLRSLLAERR